MLCPAFSCRALAVRAAAISILSHQPPRDDFWWSACPQWQNYARTEVCPIQTNLCFAPLKPFNPRVAKRHPSLPILPPYHTAHVDYQNIGTMLKTHFSASQFIVVSLKEGMFNNANVIFRTKFVDGVSAVGRTVNRAGNARGAGAETAASGAGAGGNNKGRKRGKTSAGAASGAENSANALVA